MKVFSMFSGIGGFEKGILEIDNSVEFIGYSEIDKYADMIYKLNYKDCKNYGNATKINPDKLPDIDMICGGFPCQSFSIAGKRGGIEYDTRGTLFREIIRIAESKRPKIILLENVKGLLSSQEGWDFYVIQDSLVQCGYQLEWEMFNTKDFIPQNRERVFIIGYIGKECKEKIFPIWKNDKIYNGKNESGKRQSQTENHTTKVRNNPMKADATFVNCIDSNYHKGWLNHGQRTMIADYRMDEGLRIRQDNNSPSLNADCHRDHNTNKHLTKCPPLIIHNTQPRSGDPKKGGTGHLKRKDGIVYNIDTGNTNAIEKDMNIRRLTPIECERLQGFPDNYTKYGIDKDGKKVEISDTQRYKVLGNAVSIPVISFIYKRLKKCFDI